MSTRKALIAKADALWRRIVHSRGNGRCQFNLCQNKGEEAHHIYSRRNMATRFDPNNGILLCPECHRHSHEMPENFRAVLWLDMCSVMDRLDEQAKKIVHYKAADLREIIERLKSY